MASDEATCATDNSGFHLITPDAAALARFELEFISNEYTITG